MTLQELFAFMAAALGALLWWPVGWAFAWWAALGASVLGGSVGLVLGWMWADWLNSWKPSGRLRTAAQISATAVGWVAFIVLPLWAGFLLRQ